MKKKIILSVIIIILLVVEFYILWNYIYLKYKNKAFIEKNDIEFANEIKNSPFKLEKLVLFSSGTGENKNAKFQNSQWILDIYQYTDIAIYLNATEPIKSLTISDFKSDFGNLYYLDSSKFGANQISKNYEINPLLEYTVLNDSNNENTIKFNTPIFFADCSNPITLKFVNQIAENLAIESKEKLNFDGSILKNANKKLENLKTTVSLKITLTDYNSKKYSSIITFDIPIENESNNIFEGSILQEINFENSPFILDYEK